LEKKYLSVGGSASEPPFASGGWELRPQTPTLLLLLIIASLSSSFIVLHVFYFPQKRAK